MLSLHSLLNALFSGPKPIEYIVTLEDTDNGLVLVQHYSPVVWDKIKDTLASEFTIMSIQEIY